MKQKILIFVILLSCLSPSAYSKTKDNKKDSYYFEISKNLDIFNSLFRELDLFYVDSLKPEELVRSAIDKMLAGLDPYTVYIPESELEDLKTMTTGEYGGIGSLIIKRGDKILITDPYENMPAHKNGIKAGDYIIEVDGQKVKDKTSTEVSNMLRGQPGETVTLLIERSGESKNIKKEIVREKIQIKPIDFYDVYDGMAYIHLSGFTDKSNTELKKALAELKSKNNIEGLVLDLRGNPGGIIDESVHVCNLFLPKGQEIVSTKGKDKQFDKVYKTIREPFDLEIPIVVLVNGGSASSAEIVAGALQDLDRAVIVGSRTFGKGLVQTTRPLGYEDYLKVTTAKYYTPSGRCIQAIDYEHKDSDGYAKRIPDSLTNEFKTSHGRIVRDGGGIVPDVELKEPEVVDISYRLITDYLIFDYVTEYTQKHTKIGPLENFEFTDADYEDFKKFLKDKDFTYQLRSSSILKNLKEIAKLEGYGDIAEEEFKALEEKLSPDTDKDLDAFKESIKELISIEIAKRYYFQKGEMEETLKKDDGLKKAIEILKDKEQYSSILKNNT